MSMKLNDVLKVREKTLNLNGMEIKIRSLNIAQYSALYNHVKKANNDLAWVVGALSLGIVEPEELKENINSLPPQVAFQIAMEIFELSGVGKKSAKQKVPFFNPSERT